MAHEFTVRVYYEDTDLAGIVYYANYLKFIERARTEFVRCAGVDQAQLKSKLGIVFAVRRIEADYLTSACFDDVLVINTEILNVSGARIRLRQTVHRDDTLVFDATVTLVALKQGGKPTRLPADIRLKLQ